MSVAFPSTAKPTAALRIHALHSKGICFFIIWVGLFTTGICRDKAVHRWKPEPDPPKHPFQSYVIPTVTQHSTQNQGYVFIPLVRMMYVYGWVLHQCLFLTQGTKKKNPFLFLCLCISACAKRKHVWTLLCSLLRSYLKHEVSSSLLAIMVSYLRHSNYLLIALFSVLEFFFMEIFSFWGELFYCFTK